MGWNCWCCSLVHSTGVGDLAGFASMFIIDIIITRKMGLARQEEFS